MTRIVLFGPTGYTGQLTARALATRGAGDVLLAGRNVEAMTSMSSELGGMDSAYAELGDGSLRALLRKDDVLINLVGPFVTNGGPVIRAAIDAGCIYFDCAGEGPFLRDVFSAYDQPAKDHGVALLTGFGADWVPGNFVGALALSEADRGATHSLTIDYVITGSSFGFSAGSMRSGEVIMRDPKPPYALREGRIVDAAPASRELDAGGRTVTGHLASATEPFTLPHLEPSLQELDVYISFPPASEPETDMTGRPLLGPSADARQANGQVVTAIATSVTGATLSRAQVVALNGYDYTAQLLAWGAMEAARDGIAGSGALGPVGAFGLEALAKFHVELGATVTITTGESP